jgi:hypothetical protein
MLVSQKFVFSNSACAAYAVAPTTYEMASGNSPFAHLLASRIVWQCMVLDEVGLLLVQLLNPVDDP